MADKPDTKLSESQMQTLVKFINERWQKNLNCPICESDKWTLAEHVVTPIRMERGKLALGGVAYPMAMVVCDNCGHTRFINVVRTGILEEWGGEPSEEEGKPIGQAKGEEDA